MSVCVCCCVEGVSDLCLHHIWHMVSVSEFVTRVLEIQWLSPDCRYLHLIKGEKLLFLQRGCSYPNVIFFNILTFAELILSIYAHSMCYLHWHLCLSLGTSSFKEHESCPRSVLTFSEKEASADLLEFEWLCWGYLKARRKKKQLFSR